MYVVILRLRSIEVRETEKILYIPLSGGLRIVALQHTV